MDYFFGNARNDQGLCATPGCTGAPVHMFVYRYCEKCFAVIASDMEAGRTPNLERLERLWPGTGQQAAQASPPA